MILSQGLQLLFPAFINCISLLVCIYMEQPQFEGCIPGHKRDKAALESTLPQQLLHTKLPLLFQSALGQFQAELSAVDLLYITKACNILSEGKLYSDLSTT